MEIKIKNLDAEDIVLAPKNEPLEEAEQIALSTIKDEKYVFYLHYDADQKDFLLSMLQAAGAIVENSDEKNHTLTAKMNMTQLAFIKGLNCITKVKKEQKVNPFLKEAAESESATKDRQLKEITDNEKNDIYVTESKANVEVATGVQKSVNAEEAVAEIALASTSSEDNIIATSFSAQTRSTCNNCLVNGNMETAKEISDDGYTSGTISCPGAEQWFKFTATRTGQYTIIAWSCLDTIGTLYDSCGNQIVEVDDYAPCGKLDFRIITNLTLGATYYLKVRLYGDDTGAFRLNVTDRVFAEYVTINKDAITLEMGVTYELPLTPNYAYKGYNGARPIPGLSVSLHPSNANEQKIWWFAENENVLTCSYDCDDDEERYIHVTATGVGTSKLYAEDWNENGQYDTCTVIVANPYGKMLHDLGGFSTEETNLILKLYDKVDTIFTNENTLQKAWRCARLLSEFYYDYLKYGINQWNNVAGSVTTAEGEDGEVDKQTYFINTLGYTTREFENLETGLLNNKAKADRERNVIDFVHMQYSLAARLAYTLKLDKELSNWGPILYTGNFGRYTNEEVSYLGGWLGDAILQGVDANDQVSFGNDDYMSDLDAENIYRLILQGFSSIDAINAYYSNMTSSNTRACIFLQHIPYDTVKQKIFYELIDADLYVFLSNASNQGNIVLVNYYLDLINNEQYHFDEIKSNYPDTYDFLMSLNDRLLTIAHYS